jgi:hypothetical protein
MGDVETWLILEFRDTNGTKIANSTDDRQDGKSEDKKSGAMRLQGGNMVLSTAIISVLIAFSL